MRSTILMFFCFIMLSPANIKAQNYAISLKTGTLGIGLEGMRFFGSGYAARIGFAYFSYSPPDLDGDEYTSAADLKFSSVSTLADWFPFEGAFHFTGGVIFNFNEAEVILIPSKSYNIGGRIYTPEMLGNLSANVGFYKFAPYLGFGLRNGNVKGLGFTCDIGAFYHGPPSIDLTASRLLEPSTEQAPIIEDNIKWFSFYPVITLGLIYTF